MKKVFLLLLLPLYLPAQERIFILPEHAPAVKNSIRIDSITGYPFVYRNNKWYPFADSLVFSTKYYSDSIAHANADSLSGLFVMKNDSTEIFATPTQLAAKLDKPATIVKPEWYGISADSTNCTQKFQAMLNGISAGTRIILESGKYLIDSLTIPREVSIEGYSGNIGTSHVPNGSVIVATGAADTVIRCNTGLDKGITISNVSFIGDSNKTTILKLKTYRTEIYRCYFIKTKNAILFDSSTTWAGENKIEECNFYDIAGLAVSSMGSNGADGYFINNIVQNSTGGTGKGLYLEYGAGWDIQGNHFYGGKYSIEIRKGLYTKVVNNYIENYLYVHMDDPAYVWGNIANNLFLIKHNDSAAVTFNFETTAERVNVSGNTIIAINNVTGSYGFRKTGSGTLSGDFYFNMQSACDSLYSNFDATTQAVKLENARLSTSVGTIRINTGEGSAKTTDIVSYGVKPDSSLTANGGSLALPNNGTSWDNNVNEFYFKSGGGNTGWKKVAALSRITSEGTAAPTTGTWNVGDVRYNTTPVIDGTVGWICIVAGTPGIWREFGAMTPAAYGLNQIVNGNFDSLSSGGIGKYWLLTSDPTVSGSYDAGYGGADSSQKIIQTTGTGGNKWFFTNLSTAPISMKKDSVYRLTFYAKSNTVSDKIQSISFYDVSNGFNTTLVTNLSIDTASAWTQYSYVFKATATSASSSLQIKLPFAVSGTRYFWFDKFALRRVNN